MGQGPTESLSELAPRKYPLYTEPLTPLEDVVLAVLQVRGTAKRAQQIVDTLQAWYGGESSLTLYDVRWILRDLELWKRRVKYTRRGGWYRALPSEGGDAT